MSPPSPTDDNELERFRTPAGLLALQSLPSVGPRTALKIALGQAPSALAQEHLDDRRLPAALTEAEEQLVEHREAGITTLGYFDPPYPDRLRQIPDPPPLLFARGNLDLLAAPRLAAVVGTRKPSAAGANATATLTTGLAGAGWSILSGLAAGIDTLAHHCALEAGAANVAVLAGGLDQVSPAASRPLAAEILANGGALLSEQPLGTPNLPANLIARNRLQSGLAAMVLIVECDPRSGTMRTARYAAAQGRPVFVPPDPPDIAEGEGGRLLLHTPAGELWDLLPAFGDARTLCQSLGSRPLARPFHLGRLDSDLAEASAAAGPEQLSIDPASD